MDDWLDQLQAQIEKQSSARAAMVETLITVGDYEAIKDWLTQWESEDNAPDSVQSLYRQTVSQLRLNHGLNQQRWHLENTDAAGVPSSTTANLGVNRS